MPRVQSALDLTRNELRNAKIQNLGADPTGLVPGDAGLTWYNTAENRGKIWNGTIAEALSNVLEAVASGTPALTVSAIANKSTTLTVADATGTNSGLLPSALFTRLNNATNANTVSTLVQRDASGNFAAGTITATLTGTADNATTLGGQTLAQVRDITLTTGNLPVARVTGAAVIASTKLSDFTTAPTASVAMGSQRVINVADPTSAQDAATKNYVDNVASGLDAKASVFAATVAALPTVVYANGTSGVGATLTASALGVLTVDGQTPAQGNRILVKNQATAAQNGIYTLTTVGTASVAFVLTRATDADNATEVTPGMYTFVEQGTLGGSGWVLNSTGAFTIGTTALNFAQFSGGAAYTAGNGINLVGQAITAVGTASRIAVSGTGIDIDAAYVGQTSITTLGTVATGTWNATAIAVAKGGTGGTTPATARSGIAATGKAMVQIPATAANTAYSFAHNLNTIDVGAFVIDVATGDIVWADLKVVDANTVSVTFGAAVALNAYKIVVIG